MACLPQLGSVPAAYAVVAGGCDCPLPPAVGLSNNDVIALRTCLTSVPLVTLRSLRCMRCVGWKPRFSCPAIQLHPAHRPEAQTPLLGFVVFLFNIFYSDSHNKLYSSLTCEHAVNFLYRLSIPAGADPGGVQGISPPF